MAEEKDVEKTIAEDLVVTKYKMAGDIVNRELKTASQYIYYFIIVNIYFCYDALLLYTRKSHMGSPAIPAYKAMWPTFYNILLKYH